MKVTSIESRRLQRLLRSPRCLVLDCRPYLPFTASSVRGSLNVCLNSVLLRRHARGAATPLQHLVPDESARCRLRDGHISLVVVLDERSQRWQKLKKDSPVYIAISTLSGLPAAPRICFLRGGYESFRTEFPECCVDQKSLSQEENDSNQNILCDKLPSFHKPHYDQGTPVEILPFLYLGSAYHASKCEFLANLRITALLNVSRKSAECIKDQYDYKWIPVEDNHTTDISSHFQEAIDFIDTVRHSGGKVLVHCEAGISRSPTICMAYLMKTKRLHLEEAFEYIKQRRSLISPNFSFMGQLLHYESEIFASKPSVPIMSCKRDSVSFFAEDVNIGQHFEGSCFTFPASVLAPVPLRSPVHQLKLSPITATSS
ncbi:dual specificity protein phosphatase 5 [Hyperolius riggenbachi]|uniref:dual specificity protein phosphatase 5 n=1 Tax=Hyperolius riggenbachi TaxID=752182 RepID=UPI0035A2AD36